MGDSVIDESMIATTLIDHSMIDGSYDAYADMTSFSANLCDVVQDDMGMYSASDEQDIFANRSKRLICKRCGKAFKNKVLLKRHAAMHTKELIFECEECYKKFNRKESLTRHMLVHNGMKFFECQECGRMFNQNGHLRTHMLVHTKEKNFECDKCNMKFARKDNLKRHSLLHSRRKMHECSVCGKRFNQNGHLEAHMLVHTQEKNFQCQQCFMKFARRDTLKRHMLVHTKEKTFECDYCLERFIQNSHLKAHILVHTQEKKFQCTNCEKKFARKGSLKRHMLVHTGERNFECLECGKTFIQKTHLNKHQLIHVGAREKMSEDRVNEFIQNIHKVEVHIEHLSPPKTENNDDASLSPIKSNVEIHPDGDHLILEPVPTISMKDQAVSSNLLGNDSRTSSKETPTSKNITCKSEDSSTTCESEKATTSTRNNGTCSIQTGSLQPVAIINPESCSTEPAETAVPENLAIRQINTQNLPGGTQEQDVSQMQPSNLIASSNSVMALALLDHFLTGSESQEDNVCNAGPSSKSKANNQWSQKTQQELLAAQTLSAIGQRPTVVSDNHQQLYGHGPYIGPQIIHSNMQPVPHGVIESGHAAARLRCPTNPEWIAQQKVMMHAPSDLSYNAPPPAHEVYRYYPATNVPLSHVTYTRDMGQFRDGIARLPEGSCIPAHMRASPRKPKHPQKVVVPMSELQSTLPVPPGLHSNVQMYTHDKQSSELHCSLGKQ